MVKIAKDIPTELLNIAKNINFSKVPTSEYPYKVEQLKQLAIKYSIPRRTGKVEAMELNINCPQEIATLISQMDFSQYNQIIRGIAIGYISNYLKKEGLLQ